MRFEIHYFRLFSQNEPSRPPCFQTVQDRVLLHTPKYKLNVALPYPGVTPFNSLPSSAKLAALTVCVKRAVSELAVESERGTAKWLAASSVLTLHVSTKQSASQQYRTIFPFQIISEEKQQNFHASACSYQSKEKLSTSRCRKWKRQLLDHCLSPKMCRPTRSRIPEKITRALDTAPAAAGGEMATASPKRPKQTPKKNLMAALQCKSE